MLLFKVEEERGEDHQKEALAQEDLEVQKVQEEHWTVREDTTLIVTMVSVLLLAVVVETTTTTTTMGEEEERDPQEKCAQSQGQSIGHLEVFAPNAVHVTGTLSPRLVFKDVQLQQVLTNSYCRIAQALLVFWYREKTIFYVPTPGFVFCACAVLTFLNGQHVNHQTLPMCWLQFDLN